MNFPLLSRMIGRSLRRNQASPLPNYRLNPVLFKTLTTAQADTPTKVEITSQSPSTSLNSKVENSAVRQNKSDFHKEETFKVPKGAVRYIIGPRGANLKRILDVTGGNIGFTSKDDNGQEIANLQGTSEQIEALKVSLKEQIEKWQNTGSSNVSSGSGPTQDYMEEVIVDAPITGYLIGKGGTTLRNIERESGAKIQFDFPNPKSNERSAKIRGTHAAVQKAKKLISEKVVEVASKSAGRSPGPRKSQPDDITQIVDVPSDTVSFLIGKKGKSLFWMQDQTGAAIDFGRDDVRPGVREVQVVGSKSQVEAACNEIKKRIEDFLQRKQANETMNSDHSSSGDNASRNNSN